MFIQLTQKDILLDSSGADRFDFICPHFRFGHIKQTGLVNCLVALSKYLTERYEIGIDLFHLTLGKKANKHISQNAKLFL